MFVCAGGVFSASQRTLAKTPPAPGLGPVSNGVMVSTSSKLVKQIKGNDQGAGSGSYRLLQKSGYAGTKSIRPEVLRGPMLLVTQNNPANVTQLSQVLCNVLHCAVLR